MECRLATVLLLFVCETALAEPEFRHDYNTYGTPGLIDLPSAHAMPDGELAFTFSYSKNTYRSTLTFQIAPRLSGSFRYTGLYDMDPGKPPHISSNEESTFDRSFSLSYLLLEESRRTPAISIGLNDFVGTGIYRSEHVVASKNVTPRLRLTGGIGWGRLAGVGEFRNPLGVFSSGFETRAGRSDNEGGLVEISEIFQGDAALFGGLEYQVSDKLKFTAEYSSDRYRREDGAAFIYKNPFNFGLSYQARESLNVKAHYIYGSEVGVQFTFAINPKNPPQYSGLESAPPSVVPRKSAASLGWTGNQAADAAQKTQQLASTELEKFGIGLHGLAISGTTARIEIDNRKYLAMSQAIGRTARAMTSVLPAHIETFVIIPVKNGISGAETTLRRRDLERLEFDLDGAWGSYTRARIRSTPDQLSPIPGRYPYFNYEFSPHFSAALFDPDDPFRADVGIKAEARYEPMRGLVFQGQVRKRLLGNLNASTRENDSVIQHVRSDTTEYQKKGDPALENLTGAYFYKPSKALYGRVTAGYLEGQYGGLSTEILWKPVDSRLAAGVELNYVKQRAFDQRFGFRDYEVATGHASVYYDFGNGIHGRVDAGRYLAGDWGATFALDREFKNGWSVGAFATLTDVPFDDFGEGSFDKGIRITIPIGWMSGRETRDTYTSVIRPVTRDGGARVNVNDRLYGLVRDTHQPALADSWGRFWR